MKLIHDRVIYGCENKDISYGTGKERCMRITEKLVNSPEEEGVILEYIRLAILISTAVCDVLSYLVKWYLEKEEADKINRRIAERRRKKENG